jgi:hypothetical protein
MFFLMSYILFSIFRSNEKVHVTQKFVQYTIFKINMIGMIDLKEFKGMLLDKQYTNSMNKEEGWTWYSLTQPTFVEILFKVQFFHT